MTKKRGRFGFGFYKSAGPNWHNKDGTTIKSTVRFYMLPSGHRMTIYNSRGGFVELDIYFRKQPRYVHGR